MNPYKFDVGQDVVTIGLNGDRYACKVLYKYTSDEYTHRAKPHRRYVVQYPSKRVEDFSEQELYEL